MGVQLFARRWSDLYRGIASDPLDIDFAQVFEAFDHGHYVMFIVLILVVWSVETVDESDRRGFVPWRYKEGYHKF